MKNNYIAIAIFIGVLLGGLIVVTRSLKPAINQMVTPTITPVAQASLQPSPSQVLGVRTKLSGCQIQNGLPDLACTPGATFPDITKDQICTPGYAAAVRNVPVQEKDQVYEEYGLPAHGHQPGEYEIDHLISLELGGSNDISNLWPETAEPKPGFHEKDRYENFVHDQVCNGTITLEEAQRRISTNWLKYWTEAGKP